MDIQRLKDEIKTVNKKYLENEFEIILETEKEIIQNCKIKYSKLDPLGDVIEKEGKIYRGIKPQKISFFKELYTSGILQVLAKNEIMPNFKLTEYKTKVHPIVIEIEKIRVVPPAFWTYSMLREEAIFKLQLIELLNEFNYTLIDGHPYNSTFTGNKPIFIDFGSIIPRNKTNGAKKEIIKYNALAMIMMENNNIFARPYLYTELFNIQPCTNINKTKEYKMNINKKIGFLNLFKKHKFKTGKYTTKDFIKLFKKTYIEKQTFWKHYKKDLKKLVITPRYQRVIDKIKKYSPDAKSFIDLAGNSGYFANWISEQTKIKEIISTDYDEMALETGRLYYKDKKISFFALNFVERAKDAEVFKCDVLCALAISHHILLKNQYSINSFFCDLKKYSNKHVYVEFCPLGLWSQGCRIEVPEYYTEEWFEDNFKNFFKLIEKEVVNKVIIDGKELNHRILYVGEIL